MSVQMIKPLSVPVIQLPKVHIVHMVQIRNMELFIVPLKRNGNIRYEVNLLLKTSVGPLTSRLILEAQEKPADWVTWSSCFRKILNPIDSHDVYWLTHQLCEKSYHNRLICSALGQTTGRTKMKRNQSVERDILIERATNYISLF
ncbi:hypothetical protein I6N90_01085 [Paenibacillus sp. GSMTC-2017]|uniref:hypothetical protein n=1 Tax=Paenibacillus sp. GSMTC-2017 TaxID=2794350 RepID=UPI0018D98C24|nr:hypothetical protein [Paenibacillus sp. GSMTC-2017]MBH5316398.1 hypothetical protein [Paenibacillus sp. GSMTC-2017]